MAYSPITSWHTEERWAQWQRSSSRAPRSLHAATAAVRSRGSKITADGDCSHEIKRCLLLGRKAMRNLDSISKSRDIIWSTKVHLVKVMVFPVVLKDGLGVQSWVFICRTDVEAETPVFWPPDVKSLVI